MISTNPEMLTPTEAAVVSSVEVRDVNRVIDESILPKDFYRVNPDRTRKLVADACTFISFYFHAAKSLTAEERLRAIAAASPRLREESVSKLEKEWTVRQEFLTIDLAPFLKSVHQKLAPVIRNTRVPVYDVAASLAAGLPMKRILEAYPGLTVETAKLAELYATANPQRGRPREHSSLSAGAVIVSTRRTPRRKRTHEAAR